MISTFAIAILILWAGWSGLQFLMMVAKKKYLGIYFGLITELLMFLAFITNTPALCMGLLVADIIFWPIYNHFVEKKLGAGFTFLAVLFINTPLYLFLFWLFQEVR